MTENADQDGAIVPAHAGRALPAASDVTVHGGLTGESPVLVHSLHGFLDAGNGPVLASEHLLNVLPHRLIASFDSDAFLDYRARRPRMTFDADHYTGVEMPEIRLYEVTDLDGTPFLLLTGPEPDYRWNAFLNSSVGLIEAAGVRLVVGMGAIPWPTPHTRPFSVSAHATDRTHLVGHRPWVGQVEFPGHIGGVLEWRLGQRQVPAMGFAVHVPHYLAQYPHPRVAMRLLQCVADATGLRLPVAELEPAAQRAEQEITGHVERSPELAALVGALETQHDGLIAQRELGSADPATEVPTADEIGAQIEEFLADLERRGRDEKQN